MEGTWLSILPPIVAIGAAFISRRIIPALLAGILTGTFIASSGDFIYMITRSLEIIFMQTEFTNFKSITAFTNSWNLFIVLFCLVLGTMINMLNRAGGAKAYGEWASQKIKSRRGASLSTMGLGTLIFFDDYFNCLTVGAVMRPVTDKFRISRAKLAYLIDSTTAPVCILAPISSWVIEVMTQLKNSGVGTGANAIYQGNPFVLFLNTIFLNSYAWLTLVMVFCISFFKMDFGPMKKHEEYAEKTGNVFNGKEPNQEQKGFHVKTNPNGKLKDLTLPLFVFISLIIGFMFYTGGHFLFGGTHSLIETMQNMHAAKSMFYGGFLGVIFTIIYFSFRKLIAPKEFLEIMVYSFKVMFPVVMTLFLAWSLGTVIKQEVKTGVFIASLISQDFPIFMLPAIIFAFSCLTAFATGTSWGTFAIMIPICVPLAVAVSPELLVPMIAAVLSGAIYGDHTSPISDTTILSSIGSGCYHMDHVATQAPYSGLVAFICFFGFIITGYTYTLGTGFASLLSLGFGLTMLLTTLMIIRKKTAFQSNLSPQS